MTSRWLAGALIIAATSTGVASSAASIQSADATAVSAAPATAPPGASAVLTYTLAAPESVTVGRVEFRLSYPNAQLKFVKAEPSGLVLGVNGSVAATVEKGPDARSSTLRVIVAAPGGQTLPAGPLAYLAFAIDKAAKPETSIDLTHTAAAFTPDAEARPITPLSAPKLKITVARPPVPGCFFYMH